MLLSQAWILPRIYSTRNGFFSFGAGLKSNQIEDGCPPKRPSLRVRKLLNRPLNSYHLAWYTDIVVRVYRWMKPLMPFFVLFCFTEAFRTPLALWKTASREEASNSVPQRPHFLEGSLWSPWTTQKKTYHTWHWDFVFNKPWLLGAV